MKNDEIIEGKLVEEVAVEKTEVVEAKKGLFDKPKAFLNKHGKKLAAGAVVLIAGGLGYMFGKQAGVGGVSTNGDDNYSDDNTDDDYDSEDKTTEF
jgi:aspartate oxidase